DEDARPTLISLRQALRRTTQARRLRQDQLGADVALCRAGNRISRRNRNRMADRRRPRQMAAHGLAVYPRSAARYWRRICAAHSPRNENPLSPGRHGRLACAAKLDEAATAFFVRLHLHSLSG